jgi:hypothetical protein
MFRTSIHFFVLVFLLTACAPLGVITTHDFSSGQYKLKTSDGGISEIYADVDDDSLTLYRMINNEPEPSYFGRFSMKNIGAGSVMMNAIFSKYSIDPDLSTIITKLRPSVSGVPAQLNTNLNAAVYIGARKDFYTIREHKLLFRSNSYIKQIGFDAGLFAGIGNTFVNPTTTLGRTELEYDGMVFQKGVAAFFTVDRISIGLACGFDNLMGTDSRIWVYNNKPWIGLMLGIANF